MSDFGLMEAVRAYARYDEMKWMVEVRTKTGGGAYVWEPICAFNSESVAKGYAKDCREAARRHKLDMSYRVTERTHNADGLPFWSVVDTGVTLKVAP